MFFSKKKTGVPEVPKELAKYVESLEKEVQELSRELKEFKQEMRKAIAKVAVVRFNPFRETGSDQSFVVALLNQDNSGVVVTSHYLKDCNRVYSKPIVQGKSEYSLSEEEKEAIDQAIKSEARSTKSETNSNDRNSKSKTT